MKQNIVSLDIRVSDRHRNPYQEDHYTEPFDVCWVALPYVQRGRTMTHFKFHHELVSVQLSLIHFGMGGNTN